MTETREDILPTIIEHSVPNSPSVRRRKKIVRVLLPLFFAIVLGVLCWALIIDRRDAVRLAHEGRTVSARVTGKHSSSGKSSNYYLDFEFPVSGRIVTGSDGVLQKEYWDTAPGTQMPVTYLPSDPTIYRLGIITLESVAQGQRITVVAVGFLALLFGSACWYVERQLRD